MAFQFSSKRFMENKNSQSAYLEVRDVNKSFGSFKALKNISFQAGKGELISILGPSGCGKTTMLRVIAGLDQQSSGQIFIENRNVSKLSASRRNVGIVFQSYALFPNLTANQNIAYGLKKHLKRRNLIKKQVTELLHLVGLENLGTKFPAQLSGGQQQRVALARAMALSPNLLLLDEPLSALDAKVRVKLRAEIRDLQQRLGVTTIMVTHDQEEALTMADRILVMNSGELAQFGTPFEIYDQPATPFVAGFIGSMNLITSAEKREKGVYAVGDHLFQVSNENGVAQTKMGEKVLLAIRPEDITIGNYGQLGINELPSQIKSMEYRGSLFRLVLNFSNSNNKNAVLEADISTEEARWLKLEPNCRISIKFPTDRIRVYPE